MQSCKEERRQENNMRESQAQAEAGINKYSKFKTQNLKLRSYNGENRWSGFTKE